MKVCLRQSSSELVEVVDGVSYFFNLLMDVFDFSLNMREEVVICDDSFFVSDLIILLESIKRGMQFLENKVVMLLKLLMEKLVKKIWVKKKFEDGKFVKGGK